MKIISQSARDTLKIGAKLARHLRRSDIVCLFGELGSGKTVFAKGIAKGLGIKSDTVISSTFILLRQYQGKNTLYHFDLYRLNKPEDIFGLGYEEYLYNDGIVVVEWAERLRHLLPKEYLKIELLIKSDRQRLLKFSAKGSRYQNLLKNIHEDIRH